MSTNIQKPFINLIADTDSWADVLRAVPEMYRFSRPEMYNERLMSRSGRPLYFDFGWCDAHVYPPDRRTL